MELLLKPYSNKIALEMIDLQDKSFGLQLEQCVAQIKEDIDCGAMKTYDDLIQSKLPQEIERLIFNRTGLKMDLIVNQDPAAIISFFSNRHHVFIHPMWRGQFSIKEQQAILNKAQDKKGYVDLKKAKVGGLFSEYTNKLFINFHILVKEFRLTTSEIVAIILHEVGHAFYICEFSDRLESTNQVLANVAKEILSDKPQKNLTYIYKELKSINDKVSEKDADDIVNGNKVIAGYKLFKVIAESVVSQVSDSTYDQTAFEQIADHFPSQFGYGKELITALDKMHEYFSDEQKSATYNTFNTLMVVFELFSNTLVLVGSILLWGPVGLVFVSLWLGLCLRLSGDDTADHTYDNLKNRYKRIRNNYVAVLKNLDLPKEDMTNIVNKIYEIDQIIKDTYEIQHLYPLIANFLFSKAKKAKDSIREQQLLEQLAANDLYLVSATFRSQA